MKIPSQAHNKQFQLLSYKILHDLIFLSLLGLAAFIVIESALPGAISLNHGFLVTIFGIFALLQTTSFLGRRLGIEHPAKEKIHVLPIALVLMFLLIGNALLRFSLWENLLATTVIILVFTLFYQIIFSPNNGK
ncbi:MAG: hypothetical protein UY41_C0040G0004 [Candidatus Moranbacteria bacterium GW2011_GWE1_49_15]|nr:MAG: hypothetical protein UX75_C0026G0009 [Candidatus Moranbacteria bacterium GW2011_GWE2_47_10]KKW05820.1 MAG: hypothetical protein UY41_C0040G0004 [Candidatus Moranbacteria bacterium GW2011_GWE1_49_15]HBP00875.1 hypothetical protein [Candidatus Moranbacteria bacterium]